MILKKHIYQTCLPLVDIKWSGITQTPQIEYVSPPRTLHAVGYFNAVSQQT